MKDKFQCLLDKLENDDSFCNKFTTTLLDKGLLSPSLESGEGDRIIIKLKSPVSIIDALMVFDELETLI